jgi:hypothetical protein
MKYEEILKDAKITNVKSYKTIYGTKENIFACTHMGHPDCSWYCEIKETGEIIINTKYYKYTEDIINYNKTIMT